MSPRYPESAKVISRAFVRKVIQIRKNREWTALELSERITAAGFPATLDMLRVQEARGASVSLDQAFRTAEALGIPLGELITVPKCHKCMDAPPDGFLCASCGAGK